MLLYNKSLFQACSAQYCLHLDNVHNLVNRFRNAPVGGPTHLDMQ